MKVLEGSLSEVRFDWPKEEDNEETGLKELSRTLLRKNEVCYINDSLGLHRYVLLSDFNNPFHELNYQPIKN